MIERLIEINRYCATNLQPVMTKEKIIYRP